MTTQHKCRSGQIVKIENGCGCIFCDLDLEPDSRIKNIFSEDASAEYFHETKHGHVPCTKLR